MLAEHIWVVNVLIFYECTRKYWRLNGQRASKADLVFTVCSDYIVGDFKPYRWFPTECEQYKC